MVGTRERERERERETERQREKRVSEREREREREMVCQREIEMNTGEWNPLEQQWYLRCPCILVVPRSPPDRRPWAVPVYLCPLHRTASSCCRDTPHMLLESSPSEKHRFSFRTRNSGFQGWRFQDSYELSLLKKIKFVNHVLRRNTTKDNSFKRIITTTRKIR